MIDELKCANALRLLEETVAMICKQPEACALVWKIGRTRGKINFEVGNADDAIRVTGRKGKGLDAISKLALWMFRDSGIEPYIGEVINLDKGNKLDFKKYTPNLNWPREKTMKLLKELAEACFIETKIEVISEDTGDRTDVYVLFPKVTDAELSFVRLADRIFATVGIQQGRRIVVDAEEHCAVK